MAHMAAMVVPNCNLLINKHFAQHYTLCSTTNALLSNKRFAQQQMLGSTTNTLLNNKCFAQQQTLH
jgi:hypothetical protein